MKVLSQLCGCRLSTAKIKGRKRKAILQSLEREINVPELKYVAVWRQGKINHRNARLTKSL